MIEDILEEIYKEAQIIFKKNRLDNIDATLKKDIDLLIDKIESNKSFKKNYGSKTRYSPT